MTYYLLKPCKGHAGYLSTLRKNQKVDLRSLVPRLESEGYQVTDVKHLLIARRDIEVTIYPNGKLLIKEDDEAEAIRVVEEIYGIIFPEGQ
jgi:ArsR family metal-binding transcriptional regulator